MSTRLVLLSDTHLPKRAKRLPDVVLAALGAAAYLVKPISRDDLRAALTTVAFLPGSPAPAPHETDRAPSTAPITGTGA